MEEGDLENNIACNGINQTIKLISRTHRPLSIERIVLVHCGFVPVRPDTYLAVLIHRINDDSSGGYHDTVAIHRAGNQHTVLGRDTAMA